MQQTARIGHGAVASSEVPIPVMVLSVVGGIFHLAKCPREDKVLFEIDPSASLSSRGGQMAVLGFCSASTTADSGILSTNF